MDGLGESFFFHGMKEEPGIDLSDVDLGETIIADILDAPQELQDQLKTRGQYQNVQLKDTFMANIFQKNGSNGNERFPDQFRHPQMQQSKYRSSQTQEFHQYGDKPYYTNNHNSEILPPPVPRPQNEDEVIEIQSPPTPNVPHPPPNLQSSQQSQSSQLPFNMRRPKSTPPVPPSYMIPHMVPPPPRVQPRLTNELPDARKQRAMPVMEKFFSNGEEQPRRSREFRIVFRTGKFEGTNISVFMKTRRESRLRYCDDRLYSSLKYEVEMEVTSDVQGHAFFPVFFLIGKITVVDCYNHEKVMRDGGVLKGVTDCTLTNQGGKGLLTGRFHIQFIGLSYYHEKKEFSLQIELFDKDDLMNPVMVLRSPSFRIYSRKPTKKRKRGPTMPPDMGFLVKRRANDTSTPYQRFMVCMQEMLENLDMITVENERNTALEELKNAVAQRSGRASNMPPPFLNIGDDDDAKFDYI